MGGTMMGRKLVDIPWADVLCDKGGPAPELEIIRTASSKGGGGADGSLVEGCVVENHSDHQPREKIARLKSTAGLSTRLPDKGAKLQARLRQLEEEQERRGMVVDTVLDKDARKCGRVTQSQPAASPSLLNRRNASGSSFNPDTCAPSSFTSLFNRKLDAKGENRSSIAFSEELRSINRNNMSSKQNELQSYEVRHNGTVSLRTSRFMSLSNITNNDKKRYSNGDLKGILFSRDSSSRSPWSMSSSFSKRRARENHPRKDQESTKVHDVVLLDEDDTQPIQSIEEDEFDKWNTAKIYYPSRDHRECVEICYADIKCLAPASYLSSTIMNFYIQYLQKPVSATGRPRGEYHFFNTYFYKKLEEAVSCKFDRNASFTKLRRWLKGINIFQKSYIFLPIHGDLHWSLVIICIPAKEEESGPIILHLDSLGFHESKQIFENITSYLEEEWKYMNQDASPPDCPISEMIWRYLPRRIGKRKIMVPQQKNEYDCGLFVLYFMQRFIEEAPERVRLDDLAMFGSKWFLPEEASGLRKRLHDLLIEEFESARIDNNNAESPSSSGDDTCEPAESW